METWKDYTGRLKTIFQLLERIDRDFGKLDISESDIKPLLIASNSDWCTVKILAIDPKTLGPFAPAIDKMDVKIEMGIDSKGYGYLRYDYGYDHPDGGSNGKLITNCLTCEGDWV